MDLCGLQRQERMFPNRERLLKMRLNIFIIENGQIREILQMKEKEGDYNIDTIST